MSKDDRNKSVYQLITEAINEFLKNGFSDPVTLTRWSNRIQDAFYRQYQNDVYIPDYLNNIFKKFVTDDKILKFHFNPEITPFTLDKIKQEFRSELARRIFASAELIKLNREEAIANTLRRFQGFITSIPVDGLGPIEKQKIKSNIYKPIVQNSYEQRRLAIDQGHKLVSNINDIVGKQNNGIAVRWHSAYKRPGYNFREAHKLRHDKVYVLKDGWAYKEGLIKPQNGFYEDFEKPAEWPFCSCTVAYYYFLEQLPREFLTRKGQDAIGNAA